MGEAAYLLSRISRLTSASPSSSPTITTSVAAAASPDDIFLVRAAAFGVARFFLVAGLQSSPLPSSSSSSRPSSTGTAPRAAPGLAGDWPAPRWRFAGDNEAAADPTLPTVQTRATPCLDV